MTDSKGPRAIDGEVDPRFENLAAYVLDALDDEDERTAVEALIETDSAAQAEFDELTEAAELLAIAVPPIAPPARLKARILEQAAREPVPEAARLMSSVRAQKSQASSWWSRAFRSGYAVSAVAAVLVLIAAGVLGIQNNRLGDEIDSLRAALNVEAAAITSLRTELSTTMTNSETTVASMKGEMDQLEGEFDATAALVMHQEGMVSELEVANDALRQALRDQSWLTYVALKGGYKVESWLADSRTTSNAPVASGLIAVRVVGNEAVFQVHGLEQPQPGLAYTLWLLGNGEPKAVSQFAVSEIGSATFAFLLPAPFYLYSSLVVTQERIDRIGTQPSEVKFLSADAN
ncbi:MAG: anti-sigma factor [Chloroflexi bacterium]|nr:anti-sigma factor [Chloroflexota bacterium]